MTANVNRVRTRSSVVPRYPKDCSAPTARASAKTRSALLAVTRKGGAVPDQSCTPPSHDLRNAGTVNSGQTVTGNLCFLNFTSKLMLVATDDKGVSGKAIWFALPLARTLGWASVQE